MKRHFILTAALATSLLAATVLQGLTIGYGQRDLADAGPGCVGGWISAHGNMAYFCWDTEMLNAHLASLAIAAEHVTIVLHSGKMRVDNPEEKPLTGDPQSDQRAIDWSTRQVCPSDDVVTGRCKCSRRRVTVDVWIANEIRLRDLTVPKTFSIKPGGEIDQFINSHTTRN